MNLDHSNGEGDAGFETTLHYQLIEVRNFTSIPKVFK